jgi:hypothetical protein
MNQKCKSGYDMDGKKVGKKIDDGGACPYKKVLAQSGW